MSVVRKSAPKKKTPTPNKKVVAKKTTKKTMSEVKKDNIKKAKIAVGATLASLATALAAKKLYEKNKTMPPFGWKSVEFKAPKVTTKSKVNELFAKLMKRK